MDRRIVYPSQVARALDLLLTNRNAMVGLAKLSEAALGTGDVADGFSCLPTVPASLSVNIGPGQVYQVQQLEATNYSTLPPDTHSIVKQGVALDTTTLTLAPPATVGYAVNILIQVRYADFDDDSAVLPYVNAANPLQPLLGPNNTNVAQYQTRKGLVSIASKPGVANVSGTQASPLPDAGYIGLFVVTLAYGQTQITSGNIIPYAGAKTLIAKLPAVPASIQQNAWNSYFDTSSTANLITGNPVPAIQNLTNGTLVSVFVGNTNTGPITVRMPNLPDQLLLRQNGTGLLQNDVPKQSWITMRYDGTNWRLGGLALGEVPRFLANPIIFVRTDGSDLNDGSSNTASGAFASHTAALIFATSKINYNGSLLQIVKGIPGAYAAPQTAGSVNGPQSLLGGTGTILLTTAAELAGDMTQQAAYTMAGSGFANNTGILHSSFGTSLVCRGFTLQNNNPSTFGNLTCSSGSNAFLERITFAGTGTNAGGQSVVYATGNGQIRLGAGNIISTGLPFGLRANGGGIDLTQKLQINGSLNYAQAFASAEGSGGRIFATSAASVNTTDLAASVTGYRYLVQMNASIFTTGGGANFFPGNTAGSSATGGQYA